MANEVLVELQLPLEVIKSIVYQLPEKEKKTVAKILGKKTLITKKSQFQHLKGFLKGLVTQERDFLEVKQRLFRIPL